MHSSSSCKTRDRPWCEGSAGLCHMAADATSSTSWGYPPSSAEREDFIARLQAANPEEKRAQCLPLAPPALDRALSCLCASVSPDMKLNAPHRVFYTPPCLGQDLLLVCNPSEDSSAKPCYPGVFTTLFQPGGISQGTWPALQGKMGTPLAENQCGAAWDL